jgi:hypothetical protein
LSAFCLEDYFYAKIEFGGFPFCDYQNPVYVLVGWSDEGDTAAVLRFEISVFGISVFLFLLKLLYTPLLAVHCSAHTL